MSAVMEFLWSFLGTGAAAALIGFVGKDWLAHRIRAAIQEEYRVRVEAYDIKRSACLSALAIVDAVFSNREWKQSDGAEIAVAKKPVDIMKARECYNQLALACESPEVIDQYMKALGLRTLSEPEVPISPEAIVDLRNSMRKELGFGSDLQLSRERAWIATLPGAV